MSVNLLLRTAVDFIERLSITGPSRTRLSDSPSELLSGLGDTLEGKEANQSRLHMERGRGGGIKRIRRKERT